MLVVHAHSVHQLVAEVPRRAGGSEVDRLGSSTAADVGGAAEEQRADETLDYCSAQKL